MPDQHANTYGEAAAIWLDKGRADRAAILISAVERFRAAIGALGDRGAPTGASGFGQL